jgi:hypothetical protein
MSESVEIVKLAMFYLIRTCPHLLLWKHIVLINLKLYFGMFLLSLSLFRVVVGKKLTYDPIIFH